MDGLDFLVERELLPTEFGYLLGLVKRFNENHKSSSMKLYGVGKDKAELTYASRSGIITKVFNSYRETERFIKYTNLADID